MTAYATNLRRLMAREGLTIDLAAERTGLDPRTLKGLLGGSICPQPRTLHKLAVGLGVSADELFQDSTALTRRAFDRQTNPAVEAAITNQPKLFAGWTASEFDELYSRFGHGGGLTEEGALHFAAAINRRRELYRKISLLLETGDAELLSEFVEILHQRNLVRPVAASSARSVIAPCRE